MTRLANPFAVVFLAVLFLTFVTAIPAWAHVNLDSLIGGEVLVVGTTVTIEWHVIITHNLEHWALWYSTSGSGGPWIPIAADLPPGDPSVGSVHTYDWVVPATVSDNVRVRVLMDNVGNVFDIYAGSPHDLFIIEGPISEPTYTRGDCNGDGSLNLADVLASLSFQFNSGPEPSCLVACDLSDDDQVGLLDAIIELSYLFGGGNNPIVPFPHCGWDPTLGTLDCSESNLGCP